MWTLLIIPIIGVAKTRARGDDGQPFRSFEAAKAWFDEQDISPLKDAYCMHVVGSDVVETRQIFHRG